MFAIIGRLFSRRQAVARLETSIRSIRRVGTRTMLDRYAEETKKLEVVR